MNSKNPFPNGPNGAECGWPTFFQVLAYVLKALVCILKGEHYSAVSHQVTFYAMTGLYFLLELLKF